MSAAAVVEQSSPSATYYAGKPLVFTDAEGEKYVVQRGEECPAVVGFRGLPRLVRAGSVLVVDAEGVAPPESIRGLRRLHIDHISRAVYLSRHRKQRIALEREALAEADAEPSGEEIAPESATSGAVDAAAEATESDATGRTDSAGGSDGSDPGGSEPAPRQRRRRRKKTARRKKATRKKSRTKRS